MQMMESLNSASACIGDAQRAEWNVEIVASPSRITVDSMAMALKVLVVTIAILKAGLSICKLHMAGQVIRVKV
jgi:hypothetical protein